MQLSGVGLFDLRAGVVVGAGAIVRAGVVVVVVAVLIYFILNEGIRLVVVVLSGVFKQNIINSSNIAPPCILNLIGHDFPLYGPP